MGDKSSIAENLLRQRARLLSIKRCRRVEGWLLEENERFYNIRYRDVNGWAHTAVCKTSAFGGIYYADDQVISEPVNAPAVVPPPPAHPARPPFKGDPVTLEEKIAALEAENLRLREQLHYNRLL